MDLQDWRDVLLIIFTAIGSLLFLVALIFTVIIGLLSLGIVKRVRGVLKNSVQPAADNVRITAQTVRGTVEFVSDYAIKPVVKVYGTAAGARKFVSVFAKLTKRGEQE